MAGTKSLAPHDLRSPAFFCNSTFGIPLGCVVRNTFLQWQFYQVQKNKGHDDTSKSDRQIIYLEPSEPTVKRSISCPAFPSNAGCLVQQSLPEATTPRGHDSKTPLKEESSWADLSASTLTTVSTTSGKSDDDVYEVAQDSPDDRPEDFDSTPSTNKPKTQSRWDMDDNWRSPTSHDTDRRLRTRDRDSKSGRSKAPVSSNTLVLRGLPFNVTEAEVYKFVEEIGVKRYLAYDNPVNLLTNAQGKPSGFAEVYVGKIADVTEVRNKLHMEYFGNRYIEVLPYRSEKNERSFPDRRSSWRR